MQGRERGIYYENKENYDEVIYKEFLETIGIPAAVITDLDIQHDGWADYIEKAVLIPNNWI